MQRFIILLCSSLISIISSAVIAQPGLYEYKLPNGLKVLIKEDHRVPVVVTEVWYKVGSSYEPNGISGISHVLEHMMFKGTAKHGPGVFSKTVAENGGEENAFTAYDYTAYYQMIEANKLPISLELEADRMRNLQLKEEEFKKEIEVVKEERRLRTDDSPQNLTYERFLAAANVTSSYHHPVIGWMRDLDNMKINDVQKWYRTWYAPNNAILVIVGDVSPKPTMQLVQKYFGPLKAENLPVVKPLGELSDFGGRRIEVKAPAKLPLLIMGYNTPALSTATLKTDAYALDVLQAILGGGDSARLSKNLIRGAQLVSDIDTSYDIFSRLDNVFTLTAVPSQGHTTLQIEKALLDEVHHLQTKPIDSKELARVKAQVIANKIYEKDSMMNQANQIGSLEAVNLSWREIDNYIRQINSVTPAQVQAVAQKYLIPERLTIATLKPLPIPANKVAQPIDAKGGQNVR